MTGPLTTDDELVLDFFAGGGGASEGIEKAIGRSVDYAVNHDPKAIAMHRINHPGTRHLREDVFKVNPYALTRGRPVGAAWFSPDCTYHSKARGAKPFRERDVARRRRGLAGIVPRWMAAVRPRVVFLENVEEFTDWGPLLADGKPDPKRRGQSFRRWHKQIENLGYRVDMRELRACDYGAPTTRKRLFVIARCDDEEIIFPEATHGALSYQLPYRTAAECIDWSIDCPSIFERERPLADATLRRIANGIMRYVINNPRPFIIPLTHQGADRFYTLDGQFRTITGANRGELALISPVLTECANASSPRSWRADEPMRTQCANVKGGHHALVAAFLAKHYGGVVGHGVRQPLGVVTTVDHHALVTSSIVKLKGTCKDGQPVTEPLHTIQASGQHYGEVRAFLMKYYGTDQDPRIQEPLGTVTTKDRFAVVTVNIGGEPYVITDIGMRMFQRRELFRAQAFGDHYIIDRGLNEDGSVLDLTITDSVRMCGNSVSPVMSEALVRVNYAERTMRAAA